ncbi:MAG: NAD(P)H-dependent oxidoreductase [Crocinitomix sp.]|nr:NAD(P)H-dependent oxidoreductase [Crocinitomix sp.]
MKNIIAFSGSNSSQSINQHVLNYAATLADGVEMIKLTDYDIPMYNVDMEISGGIPDGVKSLQDKIMSADAVIVSTPEHNSLMPAFFKNVLDWLSRTGVKYLEDKNVLVMSVAPGNGGGQNAGDYVQKIIGYAGANVVGRIIVPRYGENFNAETGKITNADLIHELKGHLSNL